MSKDNSWEYRRGLFLPSHASRRLSTKLSRMAAVVITAEEIYGSKPSEAEVLRTIQKLGLRDWLLILSKVETILESVGIYDSKIQLQLSRTLLPRSTHSAVISRLRESEARRFSFTEWQSLILAKIALLSARSDISVNLREPSSQETVARALFGINDLISGSVAVDEDSEEKVLEFLVRSASFSTRESPKHLLARYYVLLCELPNRDKLRSSKNYIDIQRDFKHCTGVDMMLFLAAGFGLYAKYTGSALRSGGLQTPNYVINRRRIFSKAAVTPDEGSKVLSLLSFSPSEFREQHRRKYKDSVGSYFDFRFFRSKPLVRLTWARMVPVSLRFLYDRLTTGIYWYINDGLQGKERERFRRFFGDIFQLYVEELLERVFPLSSRLAQRLFCNWPYGRRSQKRASDGIISYGNKLVLIEVKTGRVRMDSTVATGKLADFDRDIDLTVIEAAKQLDRIITDFKRGELPLPDVNRSHIVRFYPVVVTLVPLPVGLLLYHRIRSRVYREGCLTDNDVAPLEFISAEELEVLEYVLSKGYTLPDLLEQKNTNPDFEDAPMEHFLYYHILNRQTAQNSYIDAKFHELMTSIRQLLFTK